MRCPPALSPSRVRHFRQHPRGRWRESNPRPRLTRQCTGGRLPTSGCRSPPADPPARGLVPPRGAVPGAHSHRRKEFGDDEPARGVTAIRRIRWSSIVQLRATRAPAGGLPPAWTTLASAHRSSAARQLVASSSCAVCLISVVTRSMSRRSWLRRSAARCRRRSSAVRGCQGGTGTGLPSPPMATIVK